MSREVTLIIDGREVRATEGEMLHDAAKRGDVEIPVFCYEPKLGEPVGACRMCLVEIEGIPKLQTSCSTPVRDGMVVHTRTDQVKHAQSAVVEFLLVNHPLDCPVCDKGGECPLQDISMGWGPGKSRMTDQKRHFEKPIELSPLVAIDRERCILCYRCVRFSQEVAEDEQLQLLERGDRTFVGTFDDRPYVAPFHGNITDLCPVGALTSYTYRFRARPWDIEQAGSVCTLCPSQCNVSFTVRDEQVKRVIARDNADVDDGWLCDRGRYGFEMWGAEERVRGPRLRGGAETSWEDAIAKAAAALQARRRPERRDRRRRLQRGGLPGPADHARGPGLAPHRLAPARGIVRETLRPPRPARALRQGPRHRRRRRDLGRRHRPAAHSPILDLRIRKAIRRNGAKLAVATERPTTLDGGGDGGRALHPGQRTRSFLAELSTSSRRGGDGRGALGTSRRRGRRGAARCREGRRRLGRAVAWDRDGATPPSSSRREPSTLAEQGGRRPARSPRDHQRPRPARGRLPPGRRPGPVPRQQAGEWAPRLIRAALESGELKTLLLFGVDPLRDFPDTQAWKKALAAADHVVAFSTFENATTAMADVVFPLETHAEKDGTVTHPDGRLQRVRPSASRPGEIRPNWGVLAELSLALGHDTGVSSQPSAFAALGAAVPFYSGITDADIARPRDPLAGHDAARKRAPSPARRRGPDSPDTQREARPPSGPIACPAPGSGLWRSPRIATSGPARSPS